MNSKTIGDITESQILAALIKAEKVVLIPFGDNQRYDMVVDENNKFIRIQCKTGRLRNGAIIADPQSSYAHRGGKRKSYTKQADLFGVYCPETNETYFIPVKITGTSITLRIEKAKNNQTKNIKWAKDFLFDNCKTLSSILENVDKDIKE